MTTFSSLQHVRVSSITWVAHADENFEADVAVLSVFEKSWLSLSTLISLDMVHVRFNTFYRCKWFFGKLQSLEQLRTLKLGMDHVRTVTASTVLGDGTMLPAAVSRLPTVTTIWIVRPGQLEQMAPDAYNYEELVLVIEAAPMLARLVLRSASVREWYAFTQVRENYPALELDEDWFSRHELEVRGSGNKSRMPSNDFHGPCLNPEIYRK